MSDLGVDRGADPDKPTVEVVYALAQQQWIESVPLTEGLTAAEAVAHSGLLDAHPEIQSQPLTLGLYGIRIEDDHRLQSGDRVEICRPLAKDPREMRRDLVEAGRVMGQPENK